jgi:hypothetical protein
LYPRQPFVVSPSNSSFQPEAFSSAVSVFGSAAGSGDAGRERRGDEHEQYGHCERPIERHATSSLENWA